MLGECVSNPPRSETPDTAACTVYHITNMSDDDERIDVGESEDLNNDSSMAGLQFPNSDRRAHHNALERKRRDHIKDSFYQLRDSIPQATGEKISRAAILNKATDFIKEMRDVTASNDSEIETLRKENMVLDEQVKRLEEARASGTSFDVDVVLEEAQKAALEKYSTLSSVQKRSATPTRGGVLPGDIKPGITGTGMVLNALTTSQGLSQLVSPVDHTYPGLSLSQSSSLRLKSDLSGQTQQQAPQVSSTGLKNNVHSSLAALTSSLRVNPQHNTSLLSTTSLPTKMTGTAPMQTKLPTSVGRSSGSVVIRTPVVTNGTRHRGVVTATTVSRAEEQPKQVESTSPTSVQSLVSSSCTSSTQPASSSSSQPTAGQVSKDTTNVLQTLLSASPLELNAVLQNLLLSAANTGSSALSETQKTMISTLVALTGTQGDHTKVPATDVEGGQPEDNLNGTSPPPVASSPINPQELLNVDTVDEPAAKRSKMDPE